MASMLQVEGLSAGYGHSIVLHDVSLEVAKGEIVGIVGPNGSGKSTFLKSVYGLTNIFNGRITFNETDITRAKPYALARLGLGYVPQVSNVFQKLTVRENLEMGGIAGSHESLGGDLEKAVSFFPRLKERQEQKAGVLSGGERQMLAIGRALISDPQLLLLDEPAASLAPKIAIEVFNKISEINSEGKTIVIVEQNVKRTLSASNRGYVFLSGRKLLEGNADEILQKDIGKMFLGRLDDESRR
jgi:branched-chain amino acid transport system ATP-binding protein